MTNESNDAEARIREEIMALPPRRRSQLLRWFIEMDRSDWDRQIEADFSDDGPGGTLLREVQTDFRATEDWKRRGELDHLIGLLQDSAEIRCGEKMARRVRALRQMAIEDGDTGMGADSLRSFLEFFTLNPSLKYPEISLTPDGDIYARWKGPQKMLLSIHFLPESRVRYVLFAPDHRRPALINRASGTDSVYGVLQTAAIFLGRTDWLVQ